MNHMKKVGLDGIKYKLLIYIVCALLVIGLIYIVWHYQPMSSTDNNNNPTYTKEDKFLLNEIFYECSRPIGGRWIPAKVGQAREDGEYFEPKSQEDLEKYCRMTAIIEYHAVLDILKMEDVDDVISKYPSTEAWVKVLNYQYIQDENYVDRILPDYKDIDIECIVVVHSPDGTRFFLEDITGGKHEYLEVESEEFLASLNNSDLEDVNTFWLNLR